MIIQKGGNLYGLGGVFHLRQTQDGLRVNGTTIIADDPADAYEKVKAAAAKGASYVDLDAKPAPAEKAPAEKAPANKAPAKKAPANKAPAKDSAKQPESEK